jgi:hypothetical protein
MKQFAFFKRWRVLLILAGLILVTTQGISLAASPEAPLIYLQYAQFDPLKAEPNIPEPQLTQIESGSPGTYLLQFSGPVQDQWKTAVEAEGVRLYSYVPDYAFIARMDGSAAQAVKTLPFVRWVGPFYPAYRLAASLQPQELKDAAPEQILHLQVQTLPDFDLGVLASQVSSWGGQIDATTQSEINGYLRLSLPQGRLADLAALDGVLWVEPVLERQLFNDIAGGTILHANLIRTNLGLYGQGQIVALADSGLDTGNLSTLHVDFTGRVLKTYSLARTNDWSDPIAHGTHVAGSILGSGKASGSDPAHHQYAGSFAGVAPEAQLVLQSIGDLGGNLTGIPLDVGDLMRTTYGDGARIHSDSWGGPSGGTAPNYEYGGYTLDSAQVDKAAWDKKDMLIVFSAGNQGVDANRDGLVDLDSLASPGTAKNVLTVGASESYRPDEKISWNQGWPSDFPVNPLADDIMANNINGMAAFSSRGPADDGRIKPDVVAPGTWIISDRTHANPDATGWGVYNDQYIYFGGTSMSTPLTSGAAAVAREWLTKLRGFTSPSAALLKAVLINGADDISPGQYISPQEVPSQRPNNVSGWGRVDLAPSIAPLAPNQVWLKDQTSGLKTGGTLTYTLSLGTTGIQTQGAEGSPVSAVELAPTVPPVGVGQLIPVQPQSVDSPQAASDVRQLIQNGGFETSGSWITANMTRTTAQAYSGSWSMASTPALNGYFYQPLSVPGDAISATLDLYVKNVNPDTQNDTIQVRIFDQTHASLIGVGPTWSFVDTNWHHLALDFGPVLASVRGKIIAVDFSVMQKDLPNAVFYVDNASMYVSTPTYGGSFRVTLAWTDYPAAAYASKTLVNDLDLEVIAPDGKHYAGNTGTYASGQCLRAGVWDACNNVEGVLLPNARYGVYKVVVHGVNIPMGPQPFALAASGDYLREGNTPLNLVYIPFIRR